MFKTWEVLGLFDQNMLNEIAERLQLRPLVSIKKYKFVLAFNQSSRIIGRVISRRRIIAKNRQNEGLT